MLFDYVLWLLPVVAAVLVVVNHNLVSNVVAVSVFSLSVAALFLRMAAPDVALTEAAIGAAISTIFLLAAIKAINVANDGIELDRMPARIIVSALVLLMFTIVAQMPEFGSADTPANKHVGKYYTENALAETGVNNAVTAVLASYRGYDTLGETYVIFTAGLAVILILPLLRKEPAKKKRAKK
jgi:multicomponent Na+:H+ antiporter subunit B